jgi:3-oxoacyl-[acyl-carrier-protein] synthase II
VQFAVAAASEAIQSSGVDPAQEPERCGCCLGVGIGAFGRIEEESLVLHQRGPRRVSPLLFAYSPPNIAAGYLAIRFGLEGPNFGISTACASGTHAIGEAFLHVAQGTADVMLAGGAEAAITPLSITSFARMGALSQRQVPPKHASCPFDLARDGFVMGEGAGVLVLEEYEHARQRGAPIVAEIQGYGSSADAHHITRSEPQGQGIARCIVAALRSGRIAPENVDYINAHGTSTQANDSAESAAIETVLGPHARKACISSTKGVTGHCLGATGAIEAIFTVLSIRDGIVPPTANYQTPDPRCRLDYTPNTARERSVKCALSLSSGFGGQNAAVAFRCLA